MLKRLLSRAGRTAPRLAPGIRIYAIGDVHGCLDQLDELLAAIEADDAGRASQVRSKLVFLGDLVDRGPASAEVVERLRQLADRRRDCRFIMGNHEEVFLAAIGGDLKALKLFCRIGGRETVLSYGAVPSTYESMDYDELAAWLTANVPAAHQTFLRGFEDVIVEGDYAFVHAGVRPGTPLLEQRCADLRWIRTPFLSHDGGFEKTIVHGHSISADVDRAPDRVGIDTGAFAGGPLTALGLEGDQQWIIATVPAKSAAG